MDSKTRNLSTVREYLAAIEHSETADAIGQFLHADMVAEEYPNRLVPGGARHDRAAMLRRVEVGRQVIASQHYEILSELADDQRVVLEVAWSGTLAVAYGEQLPAGSVVRARFAVFFEFRDGRILAQRNYDCFEPW